MNIAIELAKDYEFLNKSINTFKQKIITAQSLVLIYTAPFLFLRLGSYLKQQEHHTILWGALLFLVLGMVIAGIGIMGEILSDERTVILNKKRFYSKKFSDEERENLESIFQEPFENILKNKQPIDLKNALIEHLETLEKTLYTKEYIQSLKDAISEKPEHEQYLPTLKKLAQNYNNNLKENNDKFDAVNNELFKANITIFNDKKEKPLKIIEQD